jgi:hypothetical protein
MSGNVIAGIYLLLFIGVGKLIEMTNSRSDKRFRLGFDPSSLSFKGWVLLIIWIIVWVIGAFQVVKFL